MPLLLSLHLMLWKRSRSCEDRTRNFEPNAQTHACTLTAHSTWRFLHLAWCTAFWIDSLLHRTAWHWPSNSEGFTQETASLLKLQILSPMPCLASMFVRFIRLSLTMIQALDPFPWEHFYAKFPYNKHTSILQVSMELMDMVSVFVLRVLDLFTSLLPIASLLISSND